MKNISLFSIVLIAYVLMFSGNQGPRLTPRPMAEDGGTELIFPHERHVVGEEMDCTDCHDAATESTTGLDDLLPDKELCSDCHEVDDPAECATCHSDVDNAQDFPRITTYSQKFSHEKHLDAELACENCHADIATQEAGDASTLPTMVSCVDCHEDRRLEQTCATCHVESDDLLPPSHVANFAHAHSDFALHDASALDNGLTCVTCHKQDYCQDCHEGDNVERFSHPLNYEFTHALDAQSSEKACVTCHAEPAFCNDCHRDNQVLPQSHIPGWVNTVDGGRHRFEAEADLGTCISCHDDDADQVCSPCHGGIN